MHEYLTAESPEAFIDFPAPREPKSDEVLCPVCKGYGGWNLRLNAYPLHEHPNTPENRHLFSHFRSSCQQCHGWGVVKANSKDVTCIHDFKHVKNLGRCLNLYKCDCGQEWLIDSSD